MQGLNSYISYFQSFNLKTRVFISGLFVIIGAFFMGNFPASFFVKLYSKSRDWTLADFNQALKNDPSFANVFLVVSLLAYVIGFLAIILVYRLYFKSNIKKAIRPTGKLRIGRLILPGLIWFLLSLSVDLYQYFKSPELYSFYFDASTYLPLVLIGLILIPIQISFEELLFRNYILNGVSILAKNAWISILVSSIVFALMHSFNPEVTKYGFFNMMPFYFYFGLILALISYFDESLEIPLSLHFFNNLYTLLIVSMENSALNVRPLFYQLDVDILSMRWSFMLSVTIMFLVIAIVYQFKWPLKTKW